LSTRLNLHAVHVVGLFFVMCFHCLNQTQTVVFTLLLPASGISDHNKLFTCISTVADNWQWADLICKGSTRSRLRESPISMGQIDALITQQDRAGVFLDEVNGMGLGG